MTQHEDYVNRINESPQRTLGFTKKMANFLFFIGLRDVLQSIHISWWLVSRRCSYCFICLLPYRVISWLGCTQLFDQFDSTNRKNTKKELLAANDHKAIIKKTVKLRDSVCIFILPNELDSWIGFNDVPTLTTRLHWLDGRSAWWSSSGTIHSLHFQLEIQSLTTSSMKLINQFRLTLLVIRLPCFFYWEKLFLLFSSPNRSARQQRKSAIQYQMFEMFHSPDDRWRLYVPKASQYCAPVNTLVDIYLSKKE